MHLPADLFERITGCKLTAAETERYGVRHERRASMRVPFNGRAHLVYIAAGRPIAAEAQVRDVSSGGVALLHNSRLEPGQQFHLRLAAPGGFLLALRCNVARVAQVARGRYSIVGAFDGVIETKESPHPPEPKKTPQPSKAVDRVRAAILG